MRMTGRSARRMALVLMMFLAPSQGMAWSVGEHGPRKASLNVAAENDALQTRLSIHCDPAAAEQDPKWSTLLVSLSRLAPRGEPRYFGSTLLLAFQKDEKTPIEMWSATSMDANYMLTRGFVAKADAARLIALLKGLEDETRVLFRVTGPLADDPDLVAYKATLPEMRRRAMRKFQELCGLSKP